MDYVILCLHKNQWHQYSITGFFVGISRVRKSERYRIWPSWNSNLDSLREFRYPMETILLNQAYLCWNLSTFSLQWLVHGTLQNLPHFQIHDVTYFKSLIKFIPQFCFEHTDLKILKQPQSMLNVQYESQVGNLSVPLLQAKVQHLPLIQRALLHVKC